MDFNNCNRTFLIEFIELYKKNRCLWDSTSQDYCNRKKRNISNNIMLKKLQERIPNATLDDAKRKIVHMRISFRREYRKVAISKANGHSGDDAYEPTLWYYDLMLFTVQNGLGRKQKSNDEQKNQFELTFQQNELELAVKERDFEDVHSEDTQEIEEDRKSISLISLDQMTQDVSVEDSFNDIPQTSPSSSRISWVSDMSIRSQTPKKSKSKEAFSHQKKRKWLESANKTMTEEKEEYALIGRRCARQLQDMDEKQQIIAEKLISDVMFYGKMKRLREDSSINLGGYTQHPPRNLTSYGQQSEAYFHYQQPYMYRPPIPGYPSYPQAYDTHDQPEEWEQRGSTQEQKNNSIQIANMARLTD